jgi:hypothetical protein
VTDGLCFVLPLRQSVSHWRNRLYRLDYVTVSFFFNSRLALCRSVQQLQSPDSAANVHRVGFRLAPIRLESQQRILRSDRSCSPWRILRGLRICFITSCTISKTNKQQRWKTAQPTCQQSDVKKLFSHSEWSITGCKRNRSFAIFSCLILDEDQHFRHFRILGNLKDRMPKHLVNHFCSLAGPSALPNFRRMLWTIQLSTRKHYVSRYSSWQIMLPKWDPSCCEFYSTEAVSRHLRVQRRRHVCRRGGLRAVLAHRALTSVGTTTGSPGQLS